MTRPASVDPCQLRDRLARRLRQRGGRRVERKPGDRPRLVGLQVFRFALFDLGQTHRRQPVLAVLPEHLGQLQQAHEANGDPRLFQRLAADRVLDPLQIPDLAAGQAPGVQPPAGGGA